MSAISVFIFRSSNNRHSFSFGVLGVKIGLAYLLKASVVMILYLFSRASSTRMSSLKLEGASRLWL